jgi:hypothetical protein
MSVSVAHGQELDLKLLSPARLYQLGVEAFNQKKYTEALPYLYAYIQKTGNTNEQLLTAINKAKNSLRTAFVYYKLELGPDGRPLPSEPATTLPSESTPPTYPLIIRGRQGIDLDVITKGGLSFLRVVFDKASFGVGMGQERQNQLNPAEAAWLDRPIAQEEPHILLIPLPDQFRLTVKPGGVVANFPFFEQLQNPAVFSRLDAYNDSQGNFICTTDFSRTAQKARKRN